jgi:WD40 repeat protein
MSFPYQTGGSLSVDSPTYIKRQADVDLYEALLAGKFCYILTSRQMGKSSLRIQVMKQLQNVGIECIFIDLTGIGYEGITSDQWYHGILKLIFSQIQKASDSLENVNIQSFCQERQNLGSLQQMSEFVEMLLQDYLKTTSLVVFIDEIDNTISLPFGGDDFFAWIRYCFNQRTDSTHYQRLTFCLMGVATPTDLIQDVTKTPFNIGEFIELGRFTKEQIMPLVRNLSTCIADPVEAGNEIYKWTGGQPFLTQQLCRMLQESKMVINAGEATNKITDLVNSEIVRNWEFQDTQIHLGPIRYRLLGKEEQAVGLLSLYQKVLTEGDTTSVAVSGGDLSKVMALRLTGLVISEDGQLLPYNQIYQDVFNKVWVEQQLTKLRPYAGSFAEWLAKDKDNTFLLTGVDLKGAQQWAKEKQLSDADYQYLTTSQELDAERKIKKLNRNTNQWVSIGVTALFTALIALMSSNRNYEKSVWITEIEQANEISSDLSRGSLERLLNTIRTARKVRAKIDRLNFSNEYIPLSTIKNLHRVLTMQWHEINTFSPADVGIGIDKVEISANAQTMLFIEKKYSSRSEKREISNVRIWRKNTGYISMFGNSPGGIHDIAMSADGQTIISSSYRTIKVWRSDGTLVSTLSDHVGDIDLINVSSDGQIIAAKSNDGTIRVWRKEGTSLFIIPSDRKQVKYMAVSADGQTIVSGGNKEIEIRGQDGMIISTIAEAQGGIEYVAVSRDGQTIVTGNGKFVKTWRRDGGFISAISDHNSLDFAAIMNDNESIVTWGGDKTVKVWGRDGSFLYDIPICQNPVANITIGDDDQTIVCQDKDQVVRLLHQKEIALSVILSGQQDLVSKVQISDDGQVISAAIADRHSFPGISCGTDFQIVYVRGRKTCLKRTLERREPLETRVKAWRPDGTLISAFNRLLDSKDILAMSTDGQTIASAAGEIWRIDGTLISKLFDRHFDITSLVVSADGQTIVTGGDKVVKVWKWNGTLVSTFPFDQSWITSVAISNDNQTIVAAGNGKAEIRDRDGTLISTLSDTQDKVNSVAISADGQTVVTGGDTTVKVWGRDGTLSSTFFGHQGKVSSLSISHDSQIIVSGSLDKTVRVWKIDGTPLFTLIGNQAEVSSVAISDDNQTIISGSWDGTIRIWHFNLDYLLIKGCEQLRDYFDSHPNIRREEICPQ